MTLDDVPADTILTLTKDLDRLFRFANCDPTCHACDKTIKIGTDFQLISVSPKDRPHKRYYVDPDGPYTDEMACGKCTRADLTRAAQTLEAMIPILHSGYTRISKMQ